MLMRAYLLFVAALIVPIALSYGVDPVAMLPKILDITVTGTDQIHIFRAMMFLYLGAATFWLIAAFNPAWQRAAVIRSRCMSPWGKWPISCRPVP